MGSGYYTPANEPSDPMEGTCSHGRREFEGCCDCEEEQRDHVWRCPKHGELHAPWCMACMAEQREGVPDA